MRVFCGWESRRRISVNITQIRVLSDKKKKKINETSIFLFSMGRKGGLHLEVATTTDRWDTFERLLSLTTICDINTMVLPLKATWLSNRGWYGSTWEILFFDTDFALLTCHLPPFAIRFSHLVCWIVLCDWLLLRYCYLSVGKAFRTLNRNLIIVIVIKQQKFKRCYCNAYFTIKK